MMKQAIIGADVVRTLLREGATHELVLVGGQALKVWVEHYAIPLPAKHAYVSRDVDFLTGSAADAEVVRRLARALGGRAIFPARRAALTALVGQAVKEIGSDEVLNVDVLHRVFGADEDAVRARAVEVELGPSLTTRVMHPLDVLKSRVDNLHGLKEKQNELGRTQLEAAIAVARAFQRDSAAMEKPRAGRRSPALRYVSFIEHLALSAAGRKVATRWKIHVADSVEPGAIASRDFREKKLPQLCSLMSPGRRAELDGDSNP